MINLVYAVIAPIVSFVLAGCFAILGAMFRHHFVYIYPQHPDSGGQIWIGFILISKYFHAACLHSLFRTLLTGITSDLVHAVTKCLLVAEITGE